MLLWVLNLGFAASGAGASPIVLDLPQTGGGRAARHVRHRYFIEIDGQHFPVDSEAEARELLERARAIAERQAEAKASVAVKRLKSKTRVPVVRVQPPVITASPELHLAPLIADIRRLYDTAAEIAELRLLLARQQAMDDDDEDVLLLI